MDVTEQTRSNFIDRIERRRLEVKPIGDHEFGARCCFGIQDFPALGRRDFEGFLSEHVNPGFQRGDNKLRVTPVRRRQIDCIEGPRGEGFLELLVAEDSFNAVPLPEFPGFNRI